MCCATLVLRHPTRIRLPHPAARRNAHYEFGGLSGLAVDPKRASVRVYDLPGDIEAEHARLPRKKGSKIRSCSSGGMPGPRSVTRISTASSTGAAEMPIQLKRARKSLNIVQSV